MHRTFVYRPDVRRSADLMNAGNPPASGPQIRSLQETANGLGYAADLLARVLRNKFTRTSPEELTRAEAARMLAFNGAA